MSKKKLGIIGGAVATVIAVAVILLLIFGKDKSYRVIKVLQLDGSATVEREKVGELDAYEGMTLENGDTLSVDANSMLVLQMDDDKYGYVEENTILTMIAEGDERDSKTVIQLERGAITCHVEDKLSESSSYEVHTQNSVMAIRGTTFRVACFSGLQLMQYEPSNLSVIIQNQISNNKLSDYYTVTSVFEGTVSATLLNRDGTTGKSSILIAGRESWIGSDSEESYFLEESTSIRRVLLPLQTLESLLQISDNGGKLLLTDNEVTQLMNDINVQETHTIYFYVDGKLFGQQEVSHGTLPEEPALKPTENGSWNLNFGTAIVDDVDVYWTAAEE